MSNVIMSDIFTSFQDHIASEQNIREVNITCQYFLSPNQHYLFLFAFRKYETQSKKSKRTLAK